MDVIKFTKTIKIYLWDPKWPKKERKMRNKEIKDFVFASIIVAIIVLLTVTMWGFINLGGVVFITIIHIPVLIGAMVLGKKYGLLFGTVFGLSSMILASFLLGVNAPFTNPLLSVVPRMFFGFIIYPIYFMFQKLVKPRVLSATFTVIISTLIHSIIVTTLLYFVGTSGFFFTASENPWVSNNDFVVFFLGIFSVNSLIELIVAVLTVTPTVIVLEELINKDEEA